MQMLISVRSSSVRASKLSTCLYLAETPPAIFNNSFSLEFSAAMIIFGYKSLFPSTKGTFKLLTNTNGKVD